jgi:fatty acid desaturase
MPDLGTSRKETMNEGKPIRIMRRRHTSGNELRRRVVFLLFFSHFIHIFAFGRGSCWVVTWWRFLFLFFFTIFVLLLVQRGGIVRVY